MAVDGMRHVATADVARVFAILEPGTQTLGTTTALATIDTGAYQRALDAMLDTRKSVDATTRRKGPETKIGAVVDWCDRNVLVQGVGGIATIAGVGAAMISGIAAGVDHQYGVAKLAALCAVTLLTAAAACFTATGIAVKQRRRHSAERFDAADIDAMTKPWREASEPTRALVHSYLQARMKKADGAMNPAAADHRDRLLAQCTPEAQPPIQQRAATIAKAVGMILDGAYAGAECRLIEATTAEAPPSEQRAIADAVMPMLFDERGEARFGGSESERRSLYSTLKTAAAAVDAPPAVTKEYLG